MCASPATSMNSSHISETDLRVGGGRLRLRDHGGAGRLALCVPGLSANATSFDLLGERLAGPEHHVVSVDLRGRGFSDTTPAGTYGWDAHARDVLEVAAALGGGGAVDLVGHSMGTYVAMSAVAADAGMVRRLVLIDGLGPPDAAAMPPILAGLERLGAVHESVSAYVGLVRSVGAVEPWSAYWDRYYEYDLEPVESGVRSRTSREAVMEDLRFGEEHDQRDLWGAITMPTLLVRALQPLGEGGFIASAAHRDEFLERTPNARCVEVDANHYAVVTDQRTAAAVVAFLDEPGA